MEKKNKVTMGTFFFSILSIVWLAPIFIVLINSFKKKAELSHHTYSLFTKISGL